MQKPSEGRVEVIAVVRAMVHVLVDDRAQVRIEADWAPLGCVIKIIVAGNDMGKVIGQMGRTAKSLRTIVAGASQRLRYKFDLDIQAAVTEERRTF